MKNYRALEDLNSNKMLPHIMEDYRIAASIINCFYSRLSNDDEKDILMARRMIERSKIPNNLQKLIQQKDLFKSSKFVQLGDSIDIGFPRLSFEEIEFFITIGNYQLDQSYGYIRESLKKNGNIQLMIASEDFEPQEKIICCLFHSRHKSQTEYKSFVKLRPSLPGRDSILEYYCICMVGARTVGCCSHVAALIMYFCYLKYQKAPQHLNIIDSLKCTRNKDISSDLTIETGLKRDLSFYSQTQLASKSKKVVVSEQSDTFVSNII